MNSQIQFKDELLGNKFWKNQYHHYILEKVFGHRNLISQLPPIPKYGIPSLPKQNVQISPIRENSYPETSLKLSDWVPPRETSLLKDIVNPFVVEWKVLYKDDSLVLAKIPEKKEKETVIEFSSEEASHNSESTELNFSNPVNYQKKERFSKKYDKGNLTFPQKYEYEYERLVYNYEFLCLLFC